MGNTTVTQTLDLNARVLPRAVGATTSTGAVVALPSGTLVMSAPASLAALSVSGGTLAGTGTVTVTGNFSWTGGLMTGSGKTILSAGCVASITGGNGKTLDNGRRL